MGFHFPDRAVACGLWLHSRRAMALLSRYAWHGGALHCAPGGGGIVAGREYRALSRSAPVSDHDDRVCNRVAGNGRLLVPPGTGAGRSRGHSRTRGARQAVAQDAFCAISAAAELLAVIERATVGRGRKNRRRFFPARALELCAVLRLACVHADGKPVL